MNKILIKIGASGITNSGYYPLVYEQNWNQNRGSDNINYSLIAASGYGNPLYFEQNRNQNRGSDNINYSLIAASGYGNSLHYEQNLNQNLYQYQSFSDNRKWLH